MNIRLIVFSLLLNLTASITYSQIGIGTNSPNSIYAGVRAVRSF